MKSKAPKNKAVKTLIPITIKVCLVVSFLVGQETFFNSDLAEMMYLTNLFSVRVIELRIYILSTNLRISSKVKFYICLTISSFGKINFC